MRNFIQVTVFVFVLCSCRAKSFLDSANKKIESSIVRKGKQIFVSDYQIRKTIIKQGYLSFVNKKDTLYILGDHDLPSETYYGTIWTSKKMFSYSYRKDKIEEISPPPFKDKMLQLISVWDTAAIRKESDENYNKFNPYNTIIAYQVYGFDNEIKVNKIIFRPFR